jgi:hypothetical protein
MRPSLLQRQPDEQRGERDAQLQHRAGGRHEARGQLRIVHPLDKTDRQRRGRGRAENDSDIDRGRREGDHREDGEADLAVDRPAMW